MTFPRVQIGGPLAGEDDMLVDAAVNEYILVEKYILTGYVSLQTKLVELDQTVKVKLYLKLRLLWPTL